MLKSVMDFLFGKSPKIFDAKGNVVHQFSQDKWRQWNDRFQKNDEYNWRKHKGSERNITPPAKS